jgi:alpha-ketoglutarate-dependent taurine dioxygenase
MVSPSFRAQKSLTANIRGGNVQALTRCLEPLAYSGTLDHYAQRDLMPVIGCEYESLQVTDLLNAPNRHQRIKDLAVTVSQRGVVSLRNQDVTPQQMRGLCEILTAVAGCPELSGLLEEAERLGNPLRKGIRGSPLNHGDSLTAVHPVIRTNPVTGWKSIFANKGFTRRINGVTKDESDMLLHYPFDLVVQNHDAQVSFKWNKNDLAI